LVSELIDAIRACAMSAQVALRDAVSKLLLVIVRRGLSHPLKV
jgi:hypothetical protein